MGTAVQYYYERSPIISCVGGRQDTGEYKQAVLTGASCLQSAHIYWQGNRPHSAWTKNDHWERHQLGKKTGKGRVSYWKEVLMDSCTKYKLKVAKAMDTFGLNLSRDFFSHFKKFFKLYRLNLQLNFMVVACFGFHNLANLSFFSQEAVILHACSLKRLS